MSFYKYSLIFYFCFTLKLLYFFNKKEGIEMKKINLIIWLVNFGIVIISNAATNSKKGCYIPKGELTCVTDITTETGKKN